MLSQQLEETLRRSLSIAGEHNHEFATLEHLLLAMLEDKDALDVMRGCKLDISRLREMLDQKLMDRQVRESGICLVREELFSKCFDEIIRQVT